jgi:hypothetical protein
MVVDKSPEKLVMVPGNIVDLSSPANKAQELPDDEVAVIIPAFQSPTIDEIPDQVDLIRVVFLFDARKIVKKIFGFRMTAA